MSESAQSIKEFFLQSQTGFFLSLLRTLPNSQNTYPRFLVVACFYLSKFKTKM